MELRLKLVLSRQWGWTRAAGEPEGKQGNEADTDRREDAKQEAAELRVSDKRLWEN